ncbi:hypothetical protein N7520_007758 [Penicillium odoratum]|uniref:uncharacterized protein n=1 Tax=Penicillium odoratum TaxID=1167516 RepID=UPI002547E88E|nr:uncharacterized protein N7520_007758 [Penicillium odoratum]KAJ5760602.1 hypothetical protein N7520_007758 [Penicillium odoratum]
MDDLRPGVWGSMDAPWDIDPVDAARVEVRPMSPPFPSPKSLLQPPLRIEEWPEAIRQVQYRFRPDARCTHDMTLRYYAKGSGLICDNCGSSERFLYEFIADTPDFLTFDPEIPPQGIKILEPWIQKAITEGQYTANQIKNLVSAKMKVLVTAALQRNYITRRRKEFCIKQTEDQQSVREWVFTSRHLQAATGKRGKNQLLITAACHAKSEHALYVDLAGPSELARASTLWSTSRTDPLPRSRNCSTDLWYESPSPPTSPRRT